MIRKQQKNEIKVRKERKRECAETIDGEDVPPP